MPRWLRSPVLGLVGLGLAVAAALPVIASASSVAARLVAEERLRLPAGALEEVVAPAAARVPQGLKPDRRLEAVPPVVPPYRTARVRDGRELTLYERPGTELVAELGATTEFGSPRTLAVVKERGEWLGVLSSELANGELGWVRADDALALGATRLGIHVDLSRRRLVLRRGDEVLRRVTVAVGSASSPTPVGRFAVTDKLAGDRYGPYYGCCILALSGRQTRLPAGWQGGDRIAIHGTDDPSSIGGAASAGCLRAGNDDLRALMRQVPLGTPVFVHP